MVVILHDGRCKVVLLSALGVTEQDVVAAANFHF